jgi:hypothetical protein
MSVAYRNHGKNISEEERWAKIIIDKKGASYIEKDFFKIKTELLQHR